LLTIHRAQGFESESLDDYVYSEKKQANERNH